MLVLAFDVLRRRVASLSATSAPAPHSPTPTVGPRTPPPRRRAVRRWPKFGLHFHHFAIVDGLLAMALYSADKTMAAAQQNLCAFLKTTPPPPMLWDLTASPKQCSPPTIVAVDDGELQKNGKCIKKYIVKV